MIGIMSSSNLVQFGHTTMRSIWEFAPPLLKNGPRQVDESLIHHNSAMRCPIVLKFDTPMRYGSLLLKPRTTSETGGLKWQCSTN